MQGCRQKKVSFTLLTAGNLERQQLINLSSQKNAALKEVDLKSLKEMYKLVVNKEVNIKYN